MTQLFLGIAGPGASHGGLFRQQADKSSNNKDHINKVYGAPDLDCASRYSATMALPGAVFAGVALSYVTSLGGLNPVTGAMGFTVGAGTEEEILYTVFMATNCLTSQYCRGTITQKGKEVALSAEKRKNRAISYIHQIRKAFSFVKGKDQKIKKIACNEADKNIALVLSNTTKPKGFQQHVSANEVSICINDPRKISPPNLPSGDLVLTWDNAEIQVKS